MTKITRLLAILYGTIGAVIPFYLTPILILFSLVSLSFKAKIQEKLWVILPATGLSFLCLLGSITNIRHEFYIYTEIFYFMMIPLLFRTYNSIRFFVNVQFIFVFIVTLIGIISTTAILSQYESVSDMKYQSETWMWPFIIYGGLNGLFYAYGLLLPIFVYFLNIRHKKIRIFILLTIPFWILNLITGWHGKGIIVSYMLALLFILARRYFFVFFIIFCAIFYQIISIDIDFSALQTQMLSNVRLAEYYRLVLGISSDVPSVESLFVRLYDLYGLPAVIYSAGVIAVYLLVGLRKYLVSSIMDADAWLFVYFIFSLFATSFVTSNLFLFYVPSVFLAWSFYFYMINNRQDQTKSERTVLTLSTQSLWG